MAAMPVQPGAPAPPSRGRRRRPQRSKAVDGGKNGTADGTVGAVTDREARAEVNREEEAGAGVGMVPEEDELAVGHEAKLEVEVEAGLGGPSRPPP
ncbi:hypothetical protein COOONC_08282 [Cooperia oncophora]